MPSDREVNLRIGHKETQGVCWGSLLAWRPATSRPSLLYRAERWLTHDWAAWKLIGTEQLLKCYSRCALATSVSLIWRLGVMLHITVSGLYWRHILDSAFRKHFLSAVPAVSIQHPVTSAQSPVWHRMRPIHIRNTALCAQCPECAHGDPPLADLCVFHFISLQSSWVSVNQVVLTNYWAHQLFTVASPMDAFSSIYLCLHTCVANMAKLLFKNRNMFGRCRSQQPQAHVLKLNLSHLTQTFLLLCFLQPCLRDSLPRILLIQGCQNEECEGICEYHL